MEIKYARFNSDIICDNFGNVYKSYASGYKHNVPMPNNGYFRLAYKGKNLLHHRIVMEAFVGPSECVVDHIDHNRANNALSNLRYVSR